MKKGMKDKYKVHAANMGETLNAFANRALKETMERDVEPTTQAEN